MSAAPRRRDAFWDLIVPSARLEKRRPDPSIQAHSSLPRTDRAEELKGTQSAVRKKQRAPSAITKSNVADLYSHLCVTDKDAKLAERRATGTELSARQNPTDLDVSATEDRTNIWAESVIRRQKGNPEVTVRAHPAHPAHPYIDFAEQLKPTQLVKFNKHTGPSGFSECEVSAPKPTLHKGHSNEEPSEGSDDTEESDGERDDDDDNSETASDASSSATRRSRTSYSTPQRAIGKIQGSRTRWLKEPSDATVPKRKTAPSQSASDRRRRRRKRVKYVADESDEDSDEGDEVDEDVNIKGKENSDRGVLHGVRGPAKVRARGKKMSILPNQPPLSRRHQPWTKKEDEILFSLRNEGKSNKYIAERVLGRTTSGVKGRWGAMRGESLRPVETRLKGCRRGNKSSVISAMAQIPAKCRPWSKEDEETMISLRARGKTFKYVSKRIHGKSYDACKAHWRKMKSQYPQAVTISQIHESSRKQDTSDHQDPQLSSTSRLDQEVKEAQSNSRSAIVESEDHKLIHKSDSPNDADVDISSAKQTYQKSVAANVSVESAVTSKTPKSKATAIDQCDQRASKTLTFSEDTSPRGNGSARQNQPDTKSVIARGDSQNRESMATLGSTIAHISAQGTQKPGTHRRSSSWPQ